MSHNTIKKRNSFPIWMVMYLEPSKMKPSLGQLYPEQSDIEPYLISKAPELVFF